MALYTMTGILVWQSIGALDYYNHLAEIRAQNQNDFHVIELMDPGFMESFHLIFSSGVGLGSMALLWVSLSEQRGYRGSDAVGDAKRAWEPKALRSRSLDPTLRV